MSATSLLGDVADYLRDTAERQLLYWDVLRQRGNRYREHRDRGSPPVLAFEYEVVIDGRTLPRPVSYALLRIVPDPGCVVRPDTRPFVIVDPRAGHGPGIGGSKKDSPVGVAMRAGHPVWFVTFYPEPMPGQTIDAIREAEALFLEEVRRASGGRGAPIVAGNCQGGWAAALLAASRPELVGALVLNGAPIATWSGRRGSAPMRYTGGLLGGAWLAHLAADLGGGIFDGANLVANFENLHPAHTWLEKPYHLYRNVDTEAERFLDFERWWGGFFLLDKEEMEFIVDELFVGNGLAQGKLHEAGGAPIDLRAIRAPIVVFASKGDDITPPHQALNWILDRYEDVADLERSGQVVVYLVHEAIGHLGIFVSGNVARREHTEIVDVLGSIQALPPGLYEMVIVDAAADAPREVRLEQRTFDDVRALDDGRDDEKGFARALAVSEWTTRAYETFASPVVRALATPAFGAWLRRLHPLRLERELLSDAMPWMWPLGRLAEAVRANRHPVGEDNVLVATEKATVAYLERVVDAGRAARDAAAEALFEEVYEDGGLLATWLPALGSRRVAGSAAPRSAPVAKSAQPLRRRARRRGLAAGIARIVVLVMLSDGSADRRELRLAADALAATPELAHLDADRVRELLVAESTTVRADPARALAELPRLLPRPADRARALAVAEAIARADRVIVPAEEATLAELRLVLGG